MKLTRLFSAYDMEKCKAFTEIELEPLMNVFLRRGYLDEDYYDYISYFYKNISITQNDRDLAVIHEAGDQKRLSSQYRQS